MSNIQFATRTKEALLIGSERHYMGLICSEVTIPFFAAHANREKLKKLLPPNHYLTISKDLYFEQNFATWVTVGNGSLHLPDGQEVELFATILNTVLVVGNDILRLIARIHGQCEIHAYIEPEEAPWIVSIIRHGLDTHILRDGQGWDSVIDLLESVTTNETVVTSYSVSDDWPSQIVAGRENVIDEDDWEDLSEDQQWDLALTALKKDRSLALRREEWETYRFRNGMTAMDIVRIAKEAAQ